jgi:inorganic pyrophosphatase/exopolyphosphatase
VAGDVSKIEKAFGSLVKENSIHLKGVMSRKKEIVPPLERVF